MNRPRILGAALVLAAALPGCSKKVPECNAVIKVINPAAEKLKTASGAQGDDPTAHLKAMNEIAKVSDGAADQLSKLDLTVAEVKKLSTEYQAMSKGVATAAKDMAQAIQAVEDGGKRIEKPAKDLELAVGKHAEGCGATQDEADRKACEAFSSAMQRLPADATQTAAVDKAAAELDKIAWKADDLRQAAQAVVAAVRANNKVMGDITAAQAKADAAQKKFAEMADKEHKVVDELNKLCHE